VREKREKRERRGGEKEGEGRTVLEAALIFRRFEGEVISPLKISVNIAFTVY
jgi:hypothetical protein